MTTKKERREQECKEALLKWLKPGDTVYCKLNHVSRSGMYRVVDLFTIKDNQPIRLSGLAADLLEGYDYKHDGCKASGCGMDMGFSLVYSLSYALFPNGFTPDYDYWQNGHNYKGELLKDGGYALHCQWM